MTPVRGQASDEAAVSAISGKGPGGRVSDASLGLGHGAGIDAGRPDGSAVELGGQDDVGVTQAVIGIPPLCARPAPDDHRDSKTVVRSPAVTPSTRKPDPGGCWQLAGLRPRRTG